jgi:hypothetical protein
VIDTINRGKPNFKSQFNLLMEYFTAPSTIMVPQQQDRFYEYKLGQRVRVNLSKAERTTLGFKYSLNYGTPDYRICLKIFVNSKKNVQAKYQTESVTLEADVSPGPARTHSLLFTACKLAAVQARSVLLTPRIIQGRGGGSGEVHTRPAERKMGGQYFRRREK